jgi:flagellar biosynthesis/type III secretory pathway M-ring protein FliF/YscJ
MNKLILVVFVLLAMILVVLISRKQRQAFTMPIEQRLQKLEEDDKKTDERLSLVEKDLRSAKEAEAQVNASIGDIQAIT